MKRGRAGFLFLLCVLAAATHACRGRETAAAAQAARIVPSPAAAVVDSARLVGRWLRADSDYTLEIAGVGPDGMLDARYLNPNPIHVSRAQAGNVDGALRVVVELQDKGYPGSFYTLTYDPGSDSLSGIYHHLGLNQQFEVAFSRLEQPTGR